MFFRSYQNNIIINRRRNSQNTINNIKEYSYKLSKPFYQKNQPNKSLSSNSFKSFRPSQNNYINYTVLENNERNNYISKTARESNDYFIKKNSKKFRIVNDYLEQFKKSKIIGNSYKTIINNKSYTERTSYENNKNNQSYNNIQQKKFYGFLKIINKHKGKLETKFLYETKQKDNNNTICHFDKLKDIHNLNKKTAIPINKRIKMLKEAKYSITQMKKDSINSFNSYKTIFNYNDKQNTFNFASFRNQRLKYIKPYNDISDRKPIIIKHFPKPKLEVPKFININNMKIF